MRRRWISLVLLVVFLSGTLIGCGSSDEKDQAEKQDEEQTLIFGTTLSSDVLDPTFSYASWYDVRYGILETLFRFDENLVPQPWLAESYRNVDPCTWEIV